MYKTAHSLEKIAQRVNVEVVCSAPEKLAKVCNLTNPFEKVLRRCLIRNFSLSFGKKYVGQTGRCVNVQLREHYQKVNGVQGGHLLCHCHDCRCKPLSALCKVRARHRDKTGRGKWRCSSVTHIQLWVSRHETHFSPSRASIRGFTAFTENTEPYI